MINVPSVDVEKGGKTWKRNGNTNIWRPTIIKLTDWLDKVRISRGYLSKNELNAEYDQRIFVNIFNIYICDAIQQKVHKVQKKVPKVG